ncbi:YegP family protein [Larkinella insperata]|uniref:YegP family protein n=2 Tax=Larkinella insperata TaxID=332158 RepID=A0ABW3QA41_9BACT
MHFIIETNPQSENQYQFRLMRNEQETVMTSESFKSKLDCLTAISAVRRAGSDASNYPLWDLVGNIRFNLFYGDNRLLIGTIRYKSVEDRDRALQEVVDQVAKAPARDQAPLTALAA